jgi:cyclopropane fatty-acyl-phospholipid synthase-like methyltransferase
MRKILQKLSRIFQELHYRTLIRSFSLYQPVYVGGKLTKKGDRDIYDRWEMIKKEIVSLKAQSVVDLGCAEGFYVMQAAKEFDCLSVGVESSLARLKVAQNQVVMEKNRPAGFVLGVVDEKFLEKMPQFDLVIFMSVMHHMMYKHGEAYCRNIMRKLHPKIGKAMIFEMGQSDESFHDWSKRLPDMGTNPHEWIEQFLRSCEFSKVTKIGESDSYRSGIKRAIFRVEP